MFFVVLLILLIVHKYLYHCIWSNNLIQRLIVLSLVQCDSKNDILFYQFEHFRSIRLANVKPSH